MCLAELHNTLLRVSVHPSSGPLPASSMAASSELLRTPFAAPAHACAARGALIRSPARQSPFRRGGTPDHVPHALARRLTHTGVAAVQPRALALTLTPRPCQILPNSLNCRRASFHRPRPAPGCLGNPKHAGNCSSGLRAQEEPERPPQGRWCREILHRNRVAVRGSAGGQGEGGDSQTSKEESAEEEGGGSSSSASPSQLPSSPNSVQEVVAPAAGPPETQAPPTPTPPPAAEAEAAKDPETFLPLARSVVDALRNQIFGFDTFFVTDQEAYEGGVLFRGNLRGEPSAVYNKLKQKLVAKYGEQYSLFLLKSPEDEERTVSVVVPSASLVPPLPAVPDELGASAFAFITLLTALLTNAPTPEFDFLPSTEYLAGPLLQGIPPALLFSLGLLTHEAGHWLAARALGLDLALPYFIPSWQLGSFGAITRIKSIVPSRGALVQVAAWGPLAGAAFSLLALLLSLLFLRPSPGDEGFFLTLDAAAFQDSLLVGVLAKLVLGDALREGSQVSVSPLTVAAWSSLLVNAINGIPAGELDGARIATGLFGRKAARRLFFVSLLLLGIAGIFSDVALFWVVLIYFLQRGPVPPQADEVTEPDTQTKLLGAATLVLCFLAYCPLPLEL